MPDGATHKNNRNTHKLDCTMHKLTVVSIGAKIGTMNNTPESLYAQAALLAADRKISASLDGMKHLCSGWSELISPAPVHKLLSEKLPVLEGRKHHEALYLQLCKVFSDFNVFAQSQPLTVNHARLWQFMSLRFVPTNPQGMMQFQMELAMILEELAKPILE